jgi:hypothetical protein
MYPNTLQVQRTKVESIAEPTKMPYQVRADGNENSKLYEATLPDACAACRTLAAWYASEGRTAVVEAYDGENVVFSVSSASTPPMSRHYTAPGKKKHYHQVRETEVR